MTARQLKCAFCGNAAKVGVRRGMDVADPHLFLPVCFRCRSDFHAMSDGDAIGSQAEGLVHVRHPAWMHSKKKYGYV